MSNDHPDPTTEADADLQREIRADRKFTLEEAIGRLTGPGAMKGASPISRLQQAEAIIDEYLSGHLVDSAGALSTVLLRQVKECDLLLKGFDQPLVALAGYIRQVLDSQDGLKELVREADMEWGRVYCERPFFDKDGCQPAPDDPYTLESVRTALTQLVDTLATGPDQESH